MNDVIVNADDYGMSSRTNIAILDAARRSQINSTSVDVTNGISSSDSKRLLDTGISIGLHLNLTEGIPVGDGVGLHPILGRSGQFITANLGLSRSLNVEDVVSELQTQLDHFRRLFGCNPNHLDSHQHFTYLHTDAFEAFLIFANNEKIAIRSPKPFIREETLSKFCARVKDRYRITLPFGSDDRAAYLRDLFCNYQPILRTENLYLDFDHETLSRLKSEKGSAEMIIHP